MVVDSVNKTHLVAPLLQCGLDLALGAVEVFHEAEEGEFVEEDLREFSQEVLSTVPHPEEQQDNLSHTRL